MIKYLLLLLIPVLLHTPAVYSQGYNKDSVYVYYSGWRPQNQSSLFIMDVNERMRVSPNVLNSGKGLGLELGFNPGYFFNRHLLLGVFGGVAMRDFFYKTAFKSSYRNDFNQAFNGSGFHGNDSLAVNQLASYINTGSFHDQELYYGIILRLPYKWAPIVKVYTGQLNWVYKTQYHLPVTPSSDTRNDNDLYNISHTIKWGAEVFLFGGHTKITDYGDLPFSKKKPHLFSTRFLPLSFFIEQIGSEQSKFLWEDGQISVTIPADKILSPAFMQKYSTNYYYGFRISFGMF